LTDEIKLSELVPGLRRPNQMRFLPLARLKNEGEPFYVDPEVNYYADDLFVAATERYAFGFHDWRGVFGSFEQRLATPHIWIPKPVTLVAAAAAVAIVKNPIVTRRFWAGWLKEPK
jgi:hypothetical protein